MALTSDGFKNLEKLPGVTVKDIKPAKVKVLTNKRIEKVFELTDFRIIENKNGIIKLKKGYGMKQPVLTFDSNKRTTYVEPIKYVKNVPKNDADAINKLQSLLAG